MSWKCFDCFRNQVEDVHVLDYQHSMLYDVPIEVFAYERTLEELKLDSNRIRDLPRPLFHCHGLKILSLSDNDIQTLPPAVASLINLQQLDLSKNVISVIPDNIKCCKQLHCVDVSINPLEKLPEGFTQLINLEELYLNDTYLDFLPANFGRLTRLKILELRENNLNILPKSIARLSKLERLDLGQNEFSDMPEAIGSLTNLTELWVDCNKLKSISPMIGNLKKLVHLDASSNNISWISASIDKCERLVDLTLSCNELQEIPSSIGRLKELVTLKLDDNQLRTIPSSIGNLLQLQELILSQNNLESLPCTIGLLRQLHILNVDDNRLEELPAEIGSCSSLTLLSVRNNKLQEVAAELGHLQRIKVINLSDNLLRNLPVSLLKLTHLNALWLSNNQSIPLTVLQKEFDRATGQMVCVNFMLPQTLQDSVILDHSSEPGEVPVRSRPHIRFAVEAVDEEPNHLLRAPTPYPKELRAMAKHARAIYQGPKRACKEVSENAPLLGKMRAPWPGDFQIKEAKVKKPETFSLCEQTKSALFPALSVSKTMQETSLHSVENRPMIREAKYVRQRTSAIHHNRNKLCGEILHQNHVSVPSCTDQENLRLSIASSLEHPLQPPPYHIAAAYSKQAKLFGHFNPRMRVENLPDNLYYDFESSNIYECKQGSDKQLATSELPKKNGSSFYCDLEIVGSNDTGLSSSQPFGSECCREDTANEEMGNFSENKNSAAIEEKSQCVECAVAGTFLENKVNVNIDITGIPLHLEDSGHNSKSEHLGTELCYSEISSQIFVNNFQNVQYDGVLSSGNECKKHENLEIAMYENSKEHLITNVDDNLQPVCQITSPDEEEICSGSTNKLMNGTVPLATDAVNSVVENHSDCNIAQSLNLLNLTSPESGTGKDSPFFAVNENTRLFVKPPQIVPDVVNDLISTKLHETSPKVVSILPKYDSKFCENHNYSTCNAQFMDSETLTTKKLFAYECDEQVHYNGDVLSDNTTSSKCASKIVHSQSVKSPVVQSYSATNSLATNLAPLLKSTNVSSLANSRKGNAKLWRFGLHRNPTVLSILIHKTEDLGFVVNGNVAMSLLPENQKGIFVVSIDPCGPATSLLPGDKILEVDGTDFSKINLDEALKFLQQTGNDVHMMISRLQ